MLMRPRSRPVRTLVVVGALVLAVAAVAAWQVARTSTPVTLDEALQTFRGEDGAAAMAGIASPGVYTYAAAGSEVGTVGPLRLRRAVPAEARMVVTPVPQGVEMELQVSGQHIEANRFRVERDWMVLTWRRVDVSFLGVGRDERTDVTGSARWIPRAPRVGMTWPIDYRTRALRTTGTGVVTARKVITLDGRPRTVFLIDIRTTTAGAHGGPRRERIWWSPRDRMPLRVVSSTRLDGPVGYQLHLSLSLGSAKPER